MQIHKNQRKKMGKMTILLFLLIFPTASKAQSMVTEISWNAYYTNYTGLLVLYPNNQGILKLHFYTPQTGVVWVEQDATLTNQYDIFGNCTSYINCRNPRTSANTIYYADNFIVYPNGSMYTQDAAGVWSTQIVAQVIPTYNWQAKMRQYNINTRR